MKKTASFIFLVLIIIAGIKAGFGRDTSELSFDEYLNHVLLNNLELMIRQYDVSVSEAALAASRVFEDPELEMIFPVFDEDEFSGFPRNIAFEMEVPIELFGKRRNRIRQARAEKFAAEAELDDFLRYLRAEAAVSYVEALTIQRIIERMQLTLEQLNRLIEINQALFEAGEIGEIDLMQTRLEARNFQAELFDVRAEFSGLMGEVYFLMGKIPADSIVFSGDISIEARIFDYQSLREQTLLSRPDIIAAQKRTEAGEFAMRLARAERLPDISIIAGYHNELALSPAPGFSATYAGLIIPLRFSGFNSGAYRQSVFEYEQTKTELEASILDAETALKSAYENYLLLSQKSTLFTESILQDAERVRDAIVYSYQRGDVSLLEVLDAQRTMNEVYMNYYETLAQHAKALIEISTASGQWFVDF